MHFSLTLWLIQKERSLKILSQFEIKNLVLKVTKSIDFTMLLIRVWVAVNPLVLIKTLKRTIMMKIDKIKQTPVKEKFMRFIKSIIVGFALVEKRDGLIL